MKTLFALMMLATRATAASPVFDVGYSTFAIVAVNVTSGNPVQVNSRPAGFVANVGFYRFINNHPNMDLWLGGIGVSTWTGIGEKLALGGTKAEWKVAKDFASNGAHVPIYAQAMNTVSASDRPTLTVIWFGY